MVTALFCDVVGSTSLAETMDPEDWADIVNRTVAAMAECVERYGGTVAQFAGDSILAMFGAPVAHEDDPYRAVRAGLDIIETLDRSGASPVEIQVRAGIHTGLAIVGDLSAGDLSTYSALGDTTNVAARMQAAAAPGSLLVSADTYRLVANDVTALDMGPVEVKGKTEPITVYEITSAHDVSERRRGIPGFHSPMVGRSAELAGLLELIDYAAAGTGRVTSIVGEAGVGKSRLVAELRERIVALDGAAWVVARSASYDQHRPYQLAASIVLALAGATESDDPEIIEKAVNELSAAAMGSSGSPHTGHLLQLLGLDPGHPDDDAAVLHAQYDAALGALIGGIAAGSSPLVLVCEDVHWSDASSAELLAGMLGRMRGLPLLLVVVSRPDRQSNGWDIIARADRELGDAFVETRLRPLDGDDSRRLVANLLAIESLPDDLRDLVLARSEGNPFFIEEVVRMLIDRRLIEEVSGRWVAVTEIVGLDVPDTLHGLLASRIDRLPGEVRRLAMVAAVIGRRFETRLLASVLHPDADGEELPAPAELGVLEARGLIKVVATRPELAYSFRHALIHDVAYASILKRERRRLHAEVGNALTRVYPKRLAELAPTLARHYEEADDRDRALRFLVLAGEAAFTRHAMQESHGFYERAAALLAADPEASAEMKVDIALSTAEAGMAFTPGRQTLNGLAEVRSAVESLGDPDRLARFYALLLRVRAMMEESYADPEYRDIMDRAYALAPRVDQPALRAHLEGMMGRVSRSGDEYATAARLLEGSVASLEEAGMVGEAGLNASLAADVEASRGRFAEAQQWITKGETLADASGNPNVIADVELFKGRIAAARGDLDTALTHTRLGMETAEGAGNIECTLVGNFMVADQQLRLGDAAAAIPHLERTFELGAYCDAEAMITLGHAWLAAARARLGDCDADAFTDPLQKAQAARSRSGEAAVRLHRAVAISGSPEPDWDVAFGDFERSIELFERIDARPDHARAMYACAQALDAAGREAESRTRLAEATAMFADLGISPDATVA